MSENKDARRFGRRDFLGLSAATLGAAWLAACERGADVLATDSPNPLFAKGGAGGGTVTRYPLRIPNVLSANGSVLTAAPGSVNMGGDQVSTAWMYNGQFPGPTLTAHRNDNV